MVSWGTTLEKGTMYNVVFKPSFQCRWASYPQKWKLFVHETYCENISFLSEANKRKVYHEIPPEPDLGVVLKEENEEEDKDKPKVSTFWKDGVVFNLAREVCSVALVLPYYVFQINYLTWEWKLPMLCLLTLSLPRSHYSFSLLFAVQFVWCLMGEFGFGSINNPQISVFLFSHHFSAWYCIGIVRRKSVLVTHEI